MTGVYLEDGTSIHFHQDKYRISFEGMQVVFHLKKEFSDCINRPSKIVFDYGQKQFHQEWTDGTKSHENFTGMTY